MILVRACTSSKRSKLYTVLESKELQRDGEDLTNNMRQMVKGSRYANNIMYIKVQPEINTVEAGPQY